MVLWSYIAWSSMVSNQFLWMIAVDLLMMIMWTLVVDGRNLISSECGMVHPLFCACMMSFHWKLQALNQRTHQFNIAYIYTIYICMHVLADTDGKILWRMLIHALASHKSHQAELDPNGPGRFQARTAPEVWFGLFFAWGQICGSWVPQWSARMWPGGNGNWVSVNEFYITH